MSGAYGRYFDLDHITRLEPRGSDANQTHTRLTRLTNHHPMLVKPLR